MDAVIHLDRDRIIPVDSKFSLENYNRLVEETDKNGLTVNRTPAIASLGGSQENSEEEYLILKMMRSLGVIAIDNQARV